jgi:hypothetical protein
MSSELVPTSIDRKVERYLLAVFFVVYLFTAKGYLEVSDTEYSALTAEAIVTRGRFDLDVDNGYTRQGPDGRSYSKYGIGTPLYFAPYAFVGHQLAGVARVPAAEFTRFLLSFANIPIAILTLWLFARMLRVFEIREPTIRLLLVGLGLGTLFWRYAAYDFTEALQACGIVAGVYGVVRRPGAYSLRDGLGPAALVLVKLVHVVLLPLFAAYIILRPRDSGRDRIRDLVTYFAPSVAALALIAAANYLRFGNPLESGYGSEAGLFSLAQLPQTVPALLISGDKGLLLFCPLLVVGLLGWWRFGSLRPRAAALCGAIVVVEFLLAATWHSWIGGWSWGPRLLVPTIPLWLLPAAFWLDVLAARYRWAAVAALVAVSIVAQFNGVFVKDQQIHHMRHGMLTAEERTAADSDYLVGWRVLLYKLTADDATSPCTVVVFGLAGDRPLDIAQHRTFVGLNVWTEHTARRFGKQAIRYLPLAGLAVIGFCLLRIVAISRREKQSVTLRA